MDIILKTDKKLIVYFVISLTGTAIGMVLSGSPWIGLIFISALGLLLFLFNKPVWGIGLILVLTSGFVDEERLPVLNAGFGNFHIVDLLLIFLLFLIPVKILLKRIKKLNPTPVNWPLLTFYGTAFLSLILAVTCFGVSSKNALSEFRIITFYFVFFLTTHFLRCRKDVVGLVKGCFWLTSLVALMMILQSVLGTSLEILPARVENLVTAGSEQESVIRVITPGTPFILVMAICGISIYGLTEFKMRQFVLIFQIGLLITGIVLAYNRNFWVGIILTLIILLALSPSVTKIKLIPVSLLVAALGSILILATLINGGRMQEYLVSTTDRFASLFAGEDLWNRDTLQDRFFENDFAYEKIKSNPAFGIGLGNAYRPFEEWNPKINRYIHNGYLWILMKTGFVGFIPFLAFILLALIRGYRNWRKVDDDFLKGTALGFTLALTALMLTALVSPVFMQWQTTPVIGLMIGCNEVIFQIG